MRRSRRRREPAWPGYVAPGRVLRWFNPVARNGRPRPSGRVRPLVGATGFEPATARPPAECATRLRYAPKRATGIEPALGAWKAPVPPQHFARLCPADYRARRSALCEAYAHSTGRQCDSSRSLSRTTASRSAACSRIKGLEYDTVDINPAIRSPVRKVSDQPLVPALVDGDHAVADSTAIVLYLEDAYPEPPCFPRTKTSGPNASC